MEFEPLSKDSRMYAILALMGDPDAGARAQALGIRGLPSHVIASEDVSVDQSDESDEF